MRLIDADALKQQFEIWDEDDEVVVWSIMNEINSAPTIEPEQRWISCEEVEPEEDQECWFTVNDRGFRYVNRGCFTRRYGERRDKGFITAGGFAWWNTAIAWMPILEPEPYKGDTE